MSIFKRKCQSCGERTFSFFRLTDLLGGKKLICSNCNAEFVAKGTWLFLLDILLPILSIFAILLLLSFGIFWGVILSFILSTMIGGILGYFIPIKKEN